MTAFAFFRLPKENKCTLIVQRNGEPENISAFRNLNGKAGFVIAPFDISEFTPLLLIHPEERRVYNAFSDIEKEVVEELEECALCNNSDEGTDSAAENNRTRYGIDFNNFHSQLVQGGFRKIVLARKSKVSGETSHLLEMFKRACEEYPRMYISLFSTRVSGTWLIATPELLLEETDDLWKTIALAGTMKLDSNMMSQENNDTDSGIMRSSEILWSDKNIQEQRIVATYLTECLKNFSDKIIESGPKTTRAGNLIHLRSDFSFSLKKKSVLGDLIETIHPTPAVCGLPKDISKSFIIHNENFSRKYYSGFCGPLISDDGTHLFVSLRCMQVIKDGFLLYAGGGLLSDSIEQQEWEETEAKLETMRKIISC